MWLLCGLASLPLGVTGLAHWGKTVPAPVRGNRSFPPLAFSQYAVDYGEIPPMPVVQAHFDFINRSGGPVEIVQLKPSCGCLNPTLIGGHTHYAAGAAGRFHVHIRTANETPGEHEYTVQVDYQDEQQQMHSESVTFRVTLPLVKVTIEPSEVLFYQLSGEPGQQTLHVTDFRDQPLDVLEVRCESPHATFEIGEPLVDDAGRKRTPIHIHIAEGIPPGREITWINIFTTDSEFSRLQVPMLIHGPIEPRPIVPASAVLPPASPPTGFSQPHDGGQTD